MSKIKLTILGCGGSNGVPEIACQCFVCSSTQTHPKNIRLRTSALVECQDTKLIIDTGPDFKQQAVRHNITSADAILYTHYHADHVNGISDTKILAYRNCVINCYADNITAQILQTSFGYMFNGSSDGLYSPALNMHVLEDYAQFYIKNIKIQAFAQKHYSIKSLGFRFGPIAYSTDFSELSPKSLAILEGTECWVIDCLRYNSSPGHPNLDKVMGYLYKIRPSRAILIHMSHNIDYYELKALLPTWVEPGFDGMCISLD